jgi:hypothetical protein
VRRLGPGRGTARAPKPLRKTDTADDNRTAQHSQATRLDPQLTARYGVRELHATFLQDRADDGGLAPCVMVLLPEAEAQFDLALSQARALRARIGFVCDTRVQAMAALERARRTLPRHRPVSMERAAAGGWGLASWAPP